MPTKIGIVNESINMLDHFVAQDAHLYQEEGLDVELVVQLYLGSLALLDTGEMLASSSTPRVIESILLDRTPYKFVLLTRRNPPHYVVSRPEITSVAQLKGKTLWCAGPGSTNYYMTLDWLRKNGLEPGSDVRVLPQEGPEEAFFGGALPQWVRPSVMMTSDAMMVVPPLWDWLVKEAGYNTLVELTDEYADRLVHGLAVHQDTLARQPELVRKLVRAHVRSARTIREDRETTVQCIMTRWGLSQPTAEGVWENMRDHFIAETDPSLLTLELAYFKENLERSHPDAKIDLPDPATLIDPSFMPRES